MDTIGQFNDPRYKPMPKNLILLREDLTYIYEVNGITNRLTIPAGFIFDGASVPSWATWLSAALPWFDTIYPFGDHLFAAAFHDKIWQYKGRMPLGFHQSHINGQWVDAAYGSDGKPVWTFTTSNKLFARHLRELGVGKKERRAMYLAVASPIGRWNWWRGKLPEDARPAIL